MKKVLLGVFGICIGLLSFGVVADGHEYPDNYLLNATVNGELVEHFDPDVTEYEIELPYDAFELPELLGEPAHPKSIVYPLVDWDADSNSNTVQALVCGPEEQEDGETVLCGIDEGGFIRVDGAGRVYTIVFIRAKRPGSGAASSISSRDFNFVDSDAGNEIDSEGDTGDEGDEKKDDSNNDDEVKKGDDRCTMRNDGSIFCRGDNTQSFACPVDGSGDCDDNVSESKSGQEQENSDEIEDGDDITPFGQDYNSSRSNRIKSDFVDSDDELRYAYAWAFEKGITTMPTFETARLGDFITRAQLAKMISVYAIEVLNNQPITSTVPDYLDVDDDNDGLNDEIELVFQLGLMGRTPTGEALPTFNPNGLVTRAEFATVLSRLLWGERYENPDGLFYEKHIAALLEEGILQDSNPTWIEQRGTVLLMLMRARQ